jgi:hypothetical protein
VNLRQAVDPANLRAALWALRAHHRVRNTLSAVDLEGIEIPAPPRLPDRARRGVEAALRRRGATCLMEAAVLQRWDAAHGRPRDIIIGVTSPSEGFRAHAWLDGDPDGHLKEFQELLRVPVR